MLLEKTTFVHPLKKWNYCKAQMMIKTEFYNLTQTANIHEIMSFTWTGSIGHSP